MPASPEEEFAAVKVDPEMANLSNRLPYMCLEDLCKEHGFSSITVWRPTRSKDDARSKDDKDILKCDSQTSFCTVGFAERCCEKIKPGVTLELSQTDPTESLPSLCFTKKHLGQSMSANLQVSSDSGERDVRSQLAKSAGIKGAFALWRDGAVYEFAYSHALDEETIDKINRFVATIGGSAGIAAAMTTVIAAKKLAKFTKKPSEKA